MIFGRSIKFLVRTPITTLLFIVLFAVAAFFISSGSVIWARNQATLKAYEDVFVTIATVRQKQMGMEITKTWDAFSKNYTQKSVPTFSAIVKPDVLNFPDADYILAPEKRPYYGAWRPDLKLWPTDNPKFALVANFVVEVTPLETCLPDSPVDVKIEKILSEKPKNVTLMPDLKVGDIVPFCDHYNDNPQPLFAGKTYVMCIIMGAHHDRQNLMSQLEWNPRNVDFSTQYDADGTVKDVSIKADAIAEVTDGFYETTLGQRWLNYAAGVNNSFYVLPVLPTSGTTLLLPFYNGMVYITSGEDITPDEYKNGERVCLVSERFAKNNNLSVGDMLRLPLYYANYESAPNEQFLDLPDVDATGGGTSIRLLDNKSPLNAVGDVYPVFSDHEYKITGIYLSQANLRASFALGENTVVIPAASVRESDENNIIAYGPMKDTTTTFQIPNGSIESFTQQWILQGNDELDFTFYDKGYTALHRGLENMKRISILFIAIGCAMSLALIFFFCNVFISKNKMRTAIERMLGYTKKQCAMSLLSGFLLCAILAISIGCSAGIYAAGKITSSAASKEYYSTKYTIGPISENGVSPTDDKSSSLYSPIAGFAFLIATAAISGLFMRSNVKEEPLKLLGGKRE